MSIEELEAELVVLEENLELMTTFSIRNNVADSMNLQDYMLATKMRDNMLIRIQMEKSMNKITDELD